MFESKKVMLLICEVDDLRRRLDTLEKRLKYKTFNIDYDIGFHAGTWTEYVKNQSDLIAILSDKLHALEEYIGCEWNSIPEKKGYVRRKKK